ncbi:MAG: VanZ family protein [Bacillota bacterium]|nr:VanZ family protein [Bacillota bacterium]
MNPMMSLIMLIVSIFLVTALNVVLNKNSKCLKKGIGWQHYLFGYFFILYLMITLSRVVGFPSLSEWKFCLSVGNPIFNPHINLVPFRDGIDISSVLNIILFMPLGFLLPTLWKKYRSLWKTFCYGLSFSLIIEIGQLFVSHRATDVNDLIMNTLGTICGWVIFNIVKKVSRQFADKTVVDISSSDTFAIKSEPYLYVVIAIICALLQ